MVTSVLTAPCTIFFTEPFKILRADIHSSLLLASDISPDFSKSRGEQGYLKNVPFCDTVGAPARTKYCKLNLCIKTYIIIKVSYLGIAINF